MQLSVRSPVCLYSKHRDRPNVAVRFYTKYSLLAPLAGQLLIGKNDTCFTVISLDSVRAACTAFSRFWRLKVTVCSRIRLSTRVKFAYSLQEPPLNDPVCGRSPCGSILADCSRAGLKGHQVTQVLVGTPSLGPIVRHFDNAHTPYTG